MKHTRLKHWNNSAKPTKSVPTLSRRTTLAPKRSSHSRYHTANKVPRTSVAEYLAKQRLANQVNRGASTSKVTTSSLITGLCTIIEVPRHCR